MKNGPLKILIGNLLINQDEQDFQNSLSTYMNMRANHIRKGSIIRGQKEVCRGSQKWGRYVVAKGLKWASPQNSYGFFTPPVQPQWESLVSFGVSLSKCCFSQSSFWDPLLAPPDEYAAPCQKGRLCQSIKLESEIIKSLYEHRLGDWEFPNCSCERFRIILTLIHRYA